MKAIIATLVLLSGFHPSLRAADVAVPDRISAAAPGKEKGRVRSYLETGGERKLETVYKTTPEGVLHLDLYYPTPQPAGTCPVIIYTHGGGWAAGSKLGAGSGSFAVVFKKLLEQGFAVASVEYRLYKPNNEVAMRDCVIDAKDAVRYLARNSAALRLDPNRFFIFGDSAGGQIAQLLLLSSPESLAGAPELAGAAYRIVAGVSWYGPCDFEKTDLFNYDDRADFRDRFGARILRTDADAKEKLARYREMSPINYLSSRSAPLLMIQGDQDTTIPVKHAHYMKEKAVATRAPVEIVIVKNAGHNWRQVGAPITPTLDEIVQRMVDFFFSHLHPAK
ncbi:MAG: alpha/beta hydrolase [Opitutaceae bacterium]|nr:alpha/beta hydrolase [Opitutaceae bacterium]